MCYRIWDAALLPGNPYAGAPPGQVLGPALSPAICRACGQVVACGQGAVLLLELERPDGSLLQGPALSDLAWTGKVWSDG